VANSRICGSLNPPMGMVTVPARTCGPLGYNDQADPDVTSLLGDTPGSLGINDYADQTIPWCSAVDAVTRLPDGVAVSISRSDPVAALAAGDKIDWQKLKKAFPAAADDHLQNIADELNNDRVKYGVATRLRQAHFFAQLRQEGGPRLLGKVEDLTYSPEALMKFSYYAAHPKEAKEDGYTRDSKTHRITKGADEEAIGNKAYGGRTDLGNGDIKSGDGYRYRGRGFMQVTGRANYTALTTTYKKYYDEQNIDFAANPELLEDFPYDLRSAVCFWKSHGLPELADAGSNPADVDAITAVINKKTDSYADRRAYFAGIYAALA
jgi:putative chitinase